MRSESFFVVEEPESEPEWVKGFALPLIADQGTPGHTPGSRYGLVPRCFLNSPETT